MSRIYNWGEHSGAKPMQGILIFNTLAEAVASGFEVFDRTTEGYLVRKRTERGWAIALAKQRTATAA
jgi:hypothetical protein